MVCALQVCWRDAAHPVLNANLITFQNVDTVFSP
jgi:hypothetical protein